MKIRKLDSVLENPSSVFRSVDENHSAEESGVSDHPGKPKGEVARNADASVDEPEHEKLEEDNVPTIEEPEPEAPSRGDESDETGVEPGPRDPD